MDVDADSNIGKKNFIYSKGVSIRKNHDQQVSHNTKHDTEFIMLILAVVGHSL